MRIRSDLHSLEKFTRRLRFFAGGFGRYFLPSAIFRYRFRRQLAAMSDSERAYAEKRVSYYVRLSPDAAIDRDRSVEVRRFRFPWRGKHRFSSYFLDLFPIVRIGRPADRFCYTFGDIDFETASPQFVKARPIVGEGACSNSVLARLNSVRHFSFVSDPIPYSEKKPLLMFRNIVRNQPHRTAFLELFHNHPMCDAGQVNDDEYVTDRAFIKNYIPVAEQLNYKFIATIEGHDVATNLKWVMSSNSIAVMPRPKIESWFMEGSLVGGYHYIEVRDDYSDLPEKLRYYLDHPDEAEAIISHAHEYVRQFLDAERELLIGRMVADRYFSLLR